VRAAYADDFHRGRLSHRCPEQDGAGSLRKECLVVRCGHPNPAVLTDLEGVRVLRTDIEAQSP
jgi:hypothetical protein